MPEAGHLGSVFVRFPLALSADFHAAHSALFSDGFSSVTARVRAGQPVRTGTEPPVIAAAIWLSRHRCRFPGAQARRQEERPKSAVIMLVMPVCSGYLSVTVGSAWRTQLDNERGKGPTQRDQPLYCPMPDSHQLAFLHVR